MQVLADIRELWQQEMGDNQLLSVAPSADSDRNPQYSVMLLDCGRLHWKIENIVGSLDANEFDYEDLMGRWWLPRSRQRASPPSGTRWRNTLPEERSSSITPT